MPTTPLEDENIDVDFQGITLPAVLLGTDLTVRRFSPSAEKILNLVSSDLNKPLTEIKLSIQAPDLDKLVKAVIHTGEVYEREIQDKLGRWYSMRIRPFKKKNVITGTVVVLVDIDDIKTASDEFKEARDYAGAIIDTLREPFLILKKDLTIESANRSFYHTFESSPEETLGKQFDQVFGNNSDLKQALDEILTLNISVRNFEMQHYFPRLGHKILLLNARKIRPDQQSAFIFLGMEDITEKREIENDRQIATAALEQFAAIASHDLKAPLRNIIMFGELLRKDVPAGENDFLDKMLEAADRMNQLMDELLNFSQMTAQVELLEAVDLNEVIKEVQKDLESIIKESNSNIQFERLPRVKANFTQMYQLFQNLIGNSIKYARQGVPPLVEITGLKIPNWFSEINVKDNGIGFDQKQAIEIFKPFKRLHGQSQYAGSGLGLALCEKIVKRYGGQIQAKSSPGNGASFIIRLPSLS